MPQDELRVISRLAENPESIIAESSSHLHSQHRPSQASRSRFDPYPASSRSRAGQGADYRFKKYPIMRLSWFPTTETLSSPRKGNLGRWTGRMEKMWLDRVAEITVHSGKPKSASQWADMSFGSMGKHLWKGTKVASADVVGHLQ